MMWKLSSRSPFVTVIVCGVVVITSGVYIFSLSSISCIFPSTPACTSRSEITPVDSSTVTRASDRFESSERYLRVRFRYHMMLTRLFKGPMSKTLLDPELIRFKMAVCLRLAVFLPVVGSDTQESLSVTVPVVILNPSPPRLNRPSSTNRAPSLIALTETSQSRTSSP